MPEFKCPHPDCEESDKTFDTKHAMHLHHYRAHGESIAKEKTTCSVSGCDTEFEYYPSEKEGKFCESCAEERNYHITSQDVEYIKTECGNCSDSLVVTDNKFEEFDSHYCNEECKYSDSNKSKVELNCAECNDCFEVVKWKAERGRKYCSQQCHINSGRKNTTCDFCDSEIVVQKGEFQKMESIFCNNSCYIKYRKDNGTLTKPCDECGSEIEITKYRNSIHPKIFCSKSCQGKYSRKKVDIICTGCGEVFKRRPSEVNESGNNFCSKSCMDNFYISKSAQNYGSGWQESRTEARKRDNYECQICGRDKSDLGQNPSVHHITPVSWFERNNFHRTDAHYKENLVLLCEHHHKKVEYGVIELEEHIDDDLAEELELETPT